MDTATLTRLRFVAVRAWLFTLALTLGPTTPTWAAPPTRVQSPAAVGSTTTSVQVTVTGVTSGNLLVALLTKEDTNTWDGIDSGTPVTDDKGNTWTAALIAGGGSCGAVNCWAAIFYAKNVAAGDTVITAAWTFNRTVRMLVQEVSGYDTTTPVDVTGSNSTTGVTEHYCAASGSIDTTTDVLVLAAGWGLGGMPLSVGTGYTQDEASGNSIWQYKSSASALTDDRGIFNSTSGTAGYGIMVSIKASGGGPPAATPRLLLMGV